ncbi:MAG: DUF1311 domain-containing protein [Eubacterium sp.]|nr:DUF1311 domain-containing protein [Eubacterium sp.]
MKKRRSYLMCVVVMSSCLMVAACGGRQEGQAAQPQEQAVAVSSAEEAVPDTNSVADSMAEVVSGQDSSGTSAESREEEPVQADSQAAAEGFTYADLTGMEFYFSSGAGGWATTMTINADGTFSGNFHDSDMGDTGEQYPNGTLYYCDFDGSFGELERVDDYTYRTELKEIDFANTPETEEIKDDIRYVYATAYGLDDAEDLYFYLPGKPVSDLPGAYVSWVQVGPEIEKNGCLTIYGLYNEKAENGFGAYPAYEEDAAESTAAVEEGSPESQPADQIRQHVEEVQKQADELEKKLEQEDLNQMEMNQVSADLYKLWNDELNDIWQYLKANMPDEEMQKLTEEERAWISSKEAQIAEEGKQYEGGSIRPLAENSLGAQLTRERVYELLEYV